MQRWHQHLNVPSEIVRTRQAFESFAARRGFQGSDHNINALALRDLSETVADALVAQVDDRSRA